MSNICLWNLKKFEYVTFLVHRIEFDAYRMDLENTKPELPQAAVALEETQRSYAHHKDLYEKLRGDVAVKMQFLDENRVSLFTFKAAAHDNSNPLFYLSD